MGTRGQWAADLAAALGNSSPSADTIDWISAWTKAENTKAAFNPLATTYDLPPNTPFNSVGVRNYETRQQGIDATVRTLRGDHPGYTEIVEGIRTNKPGLAQQGIMHAPWGTNGATVGVYWQRGGIADEQLLSESGTPPPRDPRQAPPPRDGTGPRPDISPHGGVQQPSAEHVGDGPTLGRRIVYVIIGAAFIIAGASVAVHRYVPARQIVETIAAAA